MPAWHTPPSHPVLHNDELHLWRVPPRAYWRELAELGGLLSPDERQQADRYRFEKDRNTYIVTRGLLKTILSRYLAVDPEELKLRYGKHGKPELDHPLDLPILRFNTSHSGQWTLYAFALGREVGIDVEAVNAGIDTERLAARFFSPGEAAALRALPGESRAKAFFDCWTRKEAYLKGKGVGLGYPLNRFEVALGPVEGTTLIANKEEPEDATRWIVQDVPMGDEYSAAVAVEACPSGIRFWDYGKA